MCVVNGPREYSSDLPQGDLEFSVQTIFQCT